LKKRIEKTRFSIKSAVQMVQLGGFNATL